MGWFKQKVEWYQLGLCMLSMAAICVSLWVEKVKSEIERDIYKKELKTIIYEI